MQPSPPRPPRPAHGRAQHDTARLLTCRCSPNRRRHTRPQERHQPRHDHQHGTTYAHARIARARGPQGRHTDNTQHRQGGPVPASGLPPAGPAKNGKECLRRPVERAGRLHLGAHAGRIHCATHAPTGEDAPCRRTGRPTAAREGPRGGVPTPRSTPGGRLCEGGEHSGGILNPPLLSLLPPSLPPFGRLVAFRSRDRACPLADFVAWSTSRADFLVVVRTVFLWLVTGSATLVAGFFRRSRWRWIRMRRWTIRRRRSRGWGVTGPVSWRFSAVELDRGPTRSSRATG